MRKLLATFLLFVVAYFNSSVARAGLVVTYTGDAQYAAAFTNAAIIWGDLLPTYQNGIVTQRFGQSSYSFNQQVTDIFIDATVEFIDGVGNVLGSAGPTATIGDQAGFRLATDGVMRFDSADIANLDASGRLEAVILHEMAHVMGFGTLWTQNDVYLNNSGEFTGANATLAWQRDFGQDGTPDVELEGGDGTRNGHWNENVNGGGLTGIRDSLGRDMRDELMTGWLNPNSFISDMTLQSFVDIGFQTQAIPEPTSLVFLLGSVTTFFLRRRSR